MGDVIAKIGKAVSFPGLGIGEFEVKSTIDLGPIEIAWYAIVICIGLIVAYIVCDRLSNRFNLKGDDVLDVLLFGLPAALIGARLWYVLGDIKSFDSFMDVISIWNGGLAIYGGIFGGCLAGYFVCRFKKISFLNMLDLSSIGFMIGQIIGRWGNFTNVEVYGKVTELPWRMGVGVVSDGVFSIDKFVHPLFLYESLWNLLGLFLIFAYLDFRKHKGELFLMYAAWYGIGRAWMEPLRDAEFNLKIGGLMINMVLAIAIAVVAIGLIVCLHIFKPERFKREVVEAPPSDYKPQFEYAMENAEESVDDAMEKGEENNGEDY